MLGNQRYLKKAAQVLRRGGVVAYATEACFGLGCNPRNANAVRRLLKIKRRNRAKGFIVLGASVKQLMPYVDYIPARALKTWPGPYTWLVPAKPQVPHWLRGKYSSLALRVSAHSQAAALCRVARMAIVSTSANKSGERPTRRYRETLQRLGGQVDFVLPGRIAGLARPTPISDALTGKSIRSA